MPNLIYKGGWGKNTITNDKIYLKNRNRIDKIDDLIY